ncbi:MAG TPA: metallophosphoesterase family protein [Halococcus sp.]|nr:metallophosphoesterase family protein [Halococcus sp.]
MTEDTNRIARRGVLKTAGLAAVSTPLITSAGTARGTLLGGSGPSGVHIACGSDPERSVAVGWSGGPAADAHVEYGRDGTLDTTVDANATLVPGDTLTTYSARIVGLAPDTAYEYEVVMDGEHSERFTFETAPPSPDSFRVTAVADHGIDDPDNPFQRVNTDDPIEVVERAMAQDPAFHLCIGDISYANGIPSTWELYFEEFEDFYATTPFLTVPGNHEAEPGTGLAQYDARLNEVMPIVEDVVKLLSKQRWYDFQYGNTLFMGLNTTSEDCGLPARGDEVIPIYDTRCRTELQQLFNRVQRNYIEETLQRAAANPAITWKVVFFHGPMWTSAPDHPSREDLRERWGTLFDEYGVDLVLSGDNHVYERTKPIVGERVKPYGRTFITNGTGGTSHYAFPSDDPADFLAARSNEFFGVTQLDIDDERIEVRYVTQDGSVHDAFAIVKDEAGRPTQTTVENAATGGTETVTH